jgi:hypothetical protein
MIKTKKRKWSGHVARTIKTRNAKCTWWEHLKIRDYSRDLGIYGRIILKWIKVKVSL